MSIAMAYVTVILVWTTTPLGVTWSSETVSPTVAVLLRMMLAAVVGWFILRAMRQRVCWSKEAIKKYLYADIGIFAAMYATYQAAGMIPSGLISVIYGLSPMASGFFAQYLLTGYRMPVYQWIASVIAVLGLGVIFYVDSVPNEQFFQGVGLLLIAMLLFSLSGVLIKKSTHRNGHFEQAVGAIILSIPMFICVLVIEQVPLLLKYSVSGYFDYVLGQAQQADVKSIGAILYLAIMGSLVGFVCYFYILSALSPSTVALVTLVTPVMALLLGSHVNGEQLTIDVWIGTACILCALIMFNWGGRIKRWMIRLFSIKCKFGRARRAFRAFLEL